MAGEAADEDVHGLDLVPVDGGDVAEVRDTSNRVLAVVSAEAIA